MSLSKYRWGNQQEFGRRIPSDEDRARIAKKRGGFDDSYIDKKSMKRLEKTHICFYCKKALKPKMYNHKKGFIKMGCDTDDCIGNTDTSEQRRKRKLEQLGVRRVDSKLVMDFRQLLYGRDPSRMWAVRDRIW